MSTPNVQKQPLSVYTVMLIASALLMLIACILMGIELSRFGSPWDQGTSAPNGARVIQQLPSSVASTIVLSENAIV